MAGIFSLLMVHPDRMDGEHGWIDRYARAFWIAILPLAAMVLMVQHHDTRAIDDWYADAGAPAAAEGTDTIPELPRGLDARVDAFMAELRIRSGPSDKPFQLLSGGPPAPIPAVGYDFVVAPGDGGGTGGGETGGEEGMLAVAVVDADTLSLGISADGRDLLMSLAGREEARGSLAEVIALAEALRVESPAGRL